MSGPQPRILKTVRGPHGVASRVASNVTSVVDAWALHTDVGKWILTCLREQGFWRIYLSDEGSNRWQIRVSHDSADQVAIAEVMRHLARNVVNGGLTPPPRTQIQTVSWDTAVSIALAFVERFGSFETLREEHA